MDNNGILFVLNKANIDEMIFSLSKELCLGTCKICCHA